MVGFSRIESESLAEGLRLRQMLDHCVASIQDDALEEGGIGWFVLLFLFDIVEQEINASFEHIQEDRPRAELYIPRNKVSDQEEFADDVRVLHLEHDVDANALQVVDIDDSIFFVDVVQFTKRHMVHQSVMLSCH